MSCVSIVICNTLKHREFSLVYLVSIELTVFHCTNENSELIGCALRDVNVYHCIVKSVIYCYQLNFPN